MSFNFANFVISDALAKLKLAHIFGSIIFYVAISCCTQNNQKSQIFLTENRIV